MEIKREDHQWGVRLTARPLSECGHPGMHMTVDITPKQNRNPGITVQWASSMGSIKVSDTMTWINSLRAFVEQAKAVAAELKENGVVDRAVSAEQTSDQEE
jgi:hypothetical protein